MERMYTFFARFFFLFFGKKDWIFIARRCRVRVYYYEKRWKWFESKCATALLCTHCCWPDVILEVIVFCGYWISNFSQYNLECVCVCVCVAFAHTWRVHFVALKRIRVQNSMWLGYNSVHLSGSGTDGTIVDFEYSSEYSRLCVGLCVRVCVHFEYSQFTIPHMHAAYTVHLSYSCMSLSSVSM